MTIVLLKQQCQGGESVGTGPAAASVLRLIAIVSFRLVPLGDTGGHLLQSTTGAIGVCLSGDKRHISRLAGGKRHILRPA